MERENNKLHNIKECYAISLYDDKLKAGCSSGGVATGLASIVLNKGGVVYGAAFVNNDLKHIRIKSMEDLDKIKGSKYVRSDLRECYNEIGYDLKNNKYVLFIGTPCQAAAVENYFNHHEKLYTVSFACGGTPSKKFLFDELKIHNISDFERIVFRKATEYVFEVYDEKGNLILSKNRENSNYLNLFDSKLTLRDSCVSCCYSREERVGDFTIGDYWGFDYSKGKSGFYPMSFICIQTEKARMLFDEIKKIFYLKPTDYTDVCKQNERLVCCSKTTKLMVKRTIFKFLYRLLGYRNVIFLRKYKKQIYGMFNNIRGN